MPRIPLFPSLQTAIALLTLGAAVTAHAQNAPLPAAPSTAAPSAGTGLASDILRRIGRSAGMTILTDSTVTERIPVPAGPTTAQNAPQQISAVLKSLPPTTRWMELYVPKPMNGRAWNPDDLVAYIGAQEKAFGTLGQPPAGMVDILGQHLPLQSAQPILTGLNLQRVCLVTDPGHRLAAADWPQMTRAQQKEFMSQNAATVLSMPQDQRQPLMDQLKYYDLLKDELEKQTGHDLGW